MQLELPAMSEFVFPVAAAMDAALFAEPSLAHPLYYGAELRIPVVTADTPMQLPLFVLGISGAGKVDIDGQTYDIGSSELNARFGPFWIRIATRHQ